MIVSADKKAVGGGATTGASSYEIKQLEQQNSRLRETLVRMRDLSAHEKHEFQKLQKDMDQKKSEILELGRTKEKLSARVEEMEHQIADLQEQVQASFVCRRFKRKKNKARNEEWNKAYVSRRSNLIHYRFLYFCDFLRMLVHLTDFS